MAAFDHVKNMYDVSLKPRLLRTLIKEYLPDEKQCSSWSPAQLSKVVSIIKMHGLLCESPSELIDQKQFESWKSAVDSWVDRVVILVSSNMPDKCWTGICLLGLTCQECSSERLLKSYYSWFLELLPFLQPLKHSHFVRVACCASLSDLFTRLGCYSKMKRDGPDVMACAAKLIQPLLKLVNDDDSEDVQDGAAQLLCTLIISYPFSVRHHYESIERAVSSKILSGSGSFNKLKKFVYCLASLPRSRGDDDGWSLMMRKILVVINDSLNDTFQGLEEETKRDEFIKLLALPGKDPPKPLEGYVMPSASSSRSSRKSMQVLVSRVSTLMLCCCTMLRSSYPVKVTVPVRLLLTLVERVLMVNGSLPPSSMPFVTSLQQENICSELPVLHIHSLELLSAIIKGVGSQLLPHAASIMRLILSYFKICLLPELRIKAYSISKLLLMSMGVGMALSLSQEIVNNALTDLNPVSIICSTSVDANSKASVQSPRHSSRKRKHGNAQGLVQEHIGGNGQGAEVLENRHLSSISLSIAALEVLETLLTLGGAFRSAHWRSEVDNLIISLAVDSFKEGWASDEKNTCSQNETTSTWADLQLTILRVLLASFLSSALVRPPYLSQGLELFRRGKQETGTKLAEFCAHAFLALEVLIHPRALPLNDFPDTRHKSYNDTSVKFPDVYDVALKHSMQFGVEQVAHDAPESDDDELYRKLLQSDRESDLLPDYPSKKSIGTGEPSKTSADIGAKVMSIYSSSGTQIQGKSELAREIAANAIMNPCPGDEINVAPNRLAATGDAMVTGHRSEISILPQEVVIIETVDKSGLGNEVMAQVTDRNMMLQEPGIHEPHQLAATGDAMVTVHRREISIMPHEVVMIETVDKSGLGNEVMAQVTDDNMMRQESGIHENSMVLTYSSQKSPVVPVTINSDTSNSQPHQLHNQNVLAAKHENFKFHLHDTSSTDEDTFPDIVDEDPDSDF